MELKVEARNVELKKGWQMKIEEEKENWSVIMRVLSFISGLPSKPQLIIRKAGSR